MIEPEEGLAFSKYHGLGNDYLVIDDQAGDLGLAAPAVKRICDRTRGIGSDGILLRGPDAGPGVFALRVAITNHRTRLSDVELLVKEAVRLGQELLAEHIGTGSPAPVAGRGTTQEKGVVQC